MSELETALAEASELGTWSLWSPGARDVINEHGNDGKKFAFFISTDQQDPYWKTVKVSGRGFGDTATDAVLRAIADVQLEMKRIDR